MTDVTVLAIVLTYNAPASLRACLRALDGQTRRPESVLVVDNASVTPTEEAVAGLGLPEGWSRVMRQASNGGPAGGHAAGLRAFLASGSEVAWVMDDDSLPAPDCLQRLLEKGLAGAQPMYVFPSWVQRDGTVTSYPAWCGFVIARAIVETVGVPMEELFWWAEDTEYLFWRIPGAGYPITHETAAVVEHRNVRETVHGNPPWKYYYEARNNVFYHLHVKWDLRRLPRKLGLLVARALLRERRRRSWRLVMIARGVADGVLGRLGRRVAVDPSWAA
ncbi:MAG: glycosyltransferase [Acidimicrobiales bacterium]